MKRLASRKFLLALLVFVVATALLLIGRIDGAIWSTVTMSAMGLYFTANVVQNYSPAATAQAAQQQAPP